MRVELIPMNENGLDKPVHLSLQCCHNISPLFLGLKSCVWSGIMAVVKKNRNGIELFKAGLKKKKSWQSVNPAAIAAYLNSSCRLG